MTAPTKGQELRSELRFAALDHGSRSFARAVLSAEDDLEDNPEPRPFHISRYALGELLLVLVQALEDELRELTAEKNEHQSAGYAATRARYLLGTGQLFLNVAARLEDIAKEASDSERAAKERAAS